jgi:hypothetical protein
MTSESLSGLRFQVPAALAAVVIAGAGLAGMGSPSRQADALATGLSLDKCISVETGDTFQVNIVVSDVSNLLAWDILYSYNQRIVEVIDRDVRQLLEQTPGSNVFDLSDPVPNSTGIYRLGAADTGGTGAAESGGGLLATLTLTAKSAGRSWSAIYRTDADGDGTIDIGPTLTALGGSHIGDSNGDSIFDGVIAGGQIAVDRACSNPAPTPPPPTGAVVVQPGTDPTPVIQPDGDDVPQADDPPEGSSPVTPTPETSGTPETAEAQDDAPTPTPVEFTRTEDGGGSGGLSVSTWLAGILAGSVAIGVGLLYVIHRTARRPA